MHGLKSLQFRWDIIFIVLGSTRQRPSEEKSEMSLRENFQNSSYLRIVKALGDHLTILHRAEKKNKEKQTGAVYGIMTLTCEQITRPPPPGSWTNRLAVTSAAAQPPAGGQLTPGVSVEHGVLLLDVVRGSSYTYSRNSLACLDTCERNLH